MTSKIPTALQYLASHLKKLPGVGRKTAERFAFEFLSWNEEELQALGDTFSHIKEKIFPCKTCGCLIEKEACVFCNLELRDQNQLCILASPKDCYAIEETRTYKGLYHVIEHLISPLDGRSANEIDLTHLEERIEKNKITEIIIAFDSTLEGDTTALFLKKHFAGKNLNLSRLAFGLPVGSALEYIDGGTLQKAFEGRQNF